MSPDEVTDLWTRFKTTGDPDAREALILHFQPLITTVVRSYARVGAPTSIDRADLAGFGVFGLMDAIDKFDPDRGIKFETYAIARIRGAIVDEVRGYDWVPRSVRDKAKAIERASARLTHRLHRAPTERELAAELEWTAQQLHVAHDQIGKASTMSIDRAVPGRYEVDDATEPWRSFEPVAADDDDPAGRYEIEEIRQRVVDAFAQLDDREQTLLVLYYGEGLTNVEIGTVLGVTESRVSQLHTKAMLVMSERLR